MTVKPVPSALGVTSSAAHASEAVRISPWNVSALVAAGASHQQKGDAAKAKTFYARALRVDPQNVGANNNLAVLLTEQPGGLDSEMALASKARQLAPNDPHIADTFGWVLYRRGAYRDAATLLKASGERLPDSPSVQYHLGMAAQHLGDTAAAREALKRAVSSASDFDGKDEARKALTLLK